MRGDGIGAEIIREAVKVLKAIEKRYDHTFEFSEALVGAIGDPVFDNDPKARVRPETGLLNMRKKLGLYANIRPVTSFPSLLDKSPLKRHLIENVDFMMIRELTGGIYYGELRGRTEDGTKAYDTNVYSKEEMPKKTIFYM